MVEITERFRCPACGEMLRHGRAYLCPACWPRVSASTKIALHRRDGQAVRRLRDLLEALRAGWPLEIIAIK